MQEQKNINYEQINVTPLHGNRTGKNTQTVLAQTKSDIIDLENKQEESTMSQDTYSKNEIDLKFDKISSDIHHGIEKTELKIDTLSQKTDHEFGQLQQEMRDGFEKSNLRMEKMFSDFKLDQQKEREENKKWLIALAVGSFLSIVGIIVSIITIFAQK